MKPLNHIIACIGLFAVLGCDRMPVYPDAYPQGDAFKIDIKALKEGEPSFYSFMHEGKRVNFFVLKINNDVQSFFDACMKCYPKKLGYRMDGGKLLCKACSVRYPLDSLKGIGSCYPIELKGRIEDESYIIEKGWLFTGVQYF